MSCFQVAVLASGSKGNATVMRCEAGMVLVDAGISCRRIVQGMQKLGLHPENLDGVFITHEHIDHGKGWRRLPKSTLFPSMPVPEPGGALSRPCRGLTYSYATGISLHPRRNSRWAACRCAVFPRRTMRWIPQGIPSGVRIIHLVT